MKGMLTFAGYLTIFPAASLSDCQDALAYSDSNAMPESMSFFPWSSDTSILQEKNGTWLFPSVHSRQPMEGRCLRRRMMLMSHLADSAFQQGIYTSGRTIMKAGLTLCLDCSASIRN